MHNGSQRGRTLLNRHLRLRDNMGMPFHTRDRLWMSTTGLTRLRWTDSHPVYYHRLSGAIRVFLDWHHRAILCGQYILTLPWNKVIDGTKVRQAAGIQGNNDSDSDSDSELSTVYCETLSEVYLHYSGDCE
jgi:hypothetical protein